MKVFGHPLSTCTRKVLMTLAEKGAVADFIPVDLFSAEQKKPPYLARHPFGVVPVLEDDGGFVLLESRAILRYLDRKLPGASLTPSDPTEAARMDQWLSVDQSYVAPHTGALAVQRILRKHEGLLPEPGAEQAAEAALATAFGVFEEALRGSPHLTGESFTLADISLAPYVASLDMLGSVHLLEKTPRLREWLDRMQRRASWRAALHPAQA